MHYSVECTDCNFKILEITDDEVADYVGVRCKHCDRGIYVVKEDGADTGTDEYLESTIHLNDNIVFIGDTTLPLSDELMFNNDKVSMIRELEKIGVLKVIKTKKMDMNNSKVAILDHIGINDHKLAVLTAVIVDIITGIEKAKKKTNN